LKKLSALLIVLMLAGSARAEDCNIKIVTDASPDYTDMNSLVHSITSRWPTMKEKVWALFYWTHLGRRQTAPMIIHGVECTDPIRQFNDYGFAMCSTVSGMNCRMWSALGMKVKFWDISNHTVCECFYDDKYHVYDSAFSAMYTLCDGKTIASVLDIAAEGACPASNNVKEAGHIARYHCLTCTSPQGWLQGSDDARMLQSMQGAFTGHQYRYYLNNWDDGHRYRLNLREGESYTRVYHSLGGDPAFYIPNVGEHPEKPGFDPESPQKFNIRGNGQWTFKPVLSDFKNQANTFKNIAADAAGLHPEKAGEPGEIIYKITPANVATSQSIDAQVVCKTADDKAKISISTNNGISWKDVWAASQSGESTGHAALITEVSGAYDILIKVDLQSKSAADGALLKSLEVKTTTEINAKANPHLNIGKNTIYVGQGAQTDSISVWPDNEPGKYKELVYEEKNIECGFDKEWFYYGFLHPANRNEDAYIVYKLDTPRDMMRLTYGGRFSNRSDQHHIDMSYSLDNGKTWTKSYSLTSAEQPWDTVHSESVDIPAGHRSVLCKYFMTKGASIHNVHMEAEYPTLTTAFKPYDVTFTWQEVQADRKRVQRSHTQHIESVPCKYTINVGGADHPVMEALKISMPADKENVPSGYSDGKDAGGEKYVHQWVTLGKVLSVGKPYTLSVPPKDGGKQPDKVLTDGIAGPPQAGGVAVQFGVQYDEKKTPEITVDLGEKQKCGAFRIFITAGWPWYDALNGEMKDTVEILTSEDGNTFTSRGFVTTNIYKKDVPINYMVQDNEKGQGWNYELVLKEPVDAKQVRFKVTSTRWMAITEVQALDFIKYEPFDIKIALPDEK
jgi:hypothetical protein